MERLLPVKDCANASSIGTAYGDNCYKIANKMEGTVVTYACKYVTVRYLILERISILSTRLDLSFDLLFDVVTWYAPRLLTTEQRR
jgi:hypothetical protein